MFTPVLLAVMCGLRRGEITALRWDSVDLARRRLSVVERLEQTAKGIRSKETKSGRARTVALPSLVDDELRHARIGQAEELFRVGVRLNDQTHVVAQSDGQPLQPNSLTHEFVRLLAKASDLPRIRFHDLRRTHATDLLSTVFTRRWRKSASAIRAWGSPSISIATFCPACRRTRRRRLTPQSGPR
jgi:integrase